MARNKKKKEDILIAAIKAAKRVSREQEFAAHGKSILRPIVYVNRKKYNRKRFKRDLFSFT